MNPCLSSALKYAQSNYKVFPLKCNSKNEFNHIGNNLNQIARALNNRQDISLKNIMETIKELRRMIKNLDEKVRG